MPGLTAGPLRSDIATVAVPATTDGRNMTGDDFALTAGEGHYGTGEAVMPGQGTTTFDVCLNSNAFWHNIPAAGWHDKLGGSQVLKKWLSYRERDILGCALALQEVHHLADTARRIGPMLLAGPSDYASG